MEITLSTNHKTSSTEHEIWRPNLVPTYVLDFEHKNCITLRKCMIIQTKVIKKYVFTKKKTILI